MEVPHGTTCVPRGKDHRSIHGLQPGVFAQLPTHVHRRFFPGFAPHEVQRMGVHGDGSCFFHSLAAATNYEQYLQQPVAARQERGQTFRCDFTDKMDEGTWATVATKTPHNLHHPLPSVKDNLCKPHVWAEETMIKLASTVMGLNAVFIDARKNKFYCQVRGDPAHEDTVVMMWVDHAHFEPILFVRRQCEDHVHLDGLLRCGDDASKVATIMQQFEAQCVT